MEDYVLYSVDSDNEYSEQNKENNYLKNYHNINNGTNINNLKIELMQLKNTVSILNDKIDNYKKENSELKNEIDKLNNKYLELDTKLYEKLNI